MCSARERAVIERLLRELCVSADADGLVVLEVHEGKLCHLKLQVLFSMALCPDDQARSEYREQHVFVRELSAALQARLQELADQHVGRFGKLLVTFEGGAPPLWYFIRSRR